MIRFGAHRAAGRVENSIKLLHNRFTSGGNGQVSYLLRFIFKLQNSIEASSDRCAYSKFQGIRRLEVQLDRWPAVVFDASGTDGIEKLFEGVRWVTWPEGVDLAMKRSRTSTSFPK
jgi:hypothetical protein